VYLSSFTEIICKGFATKNKNIYAKLKLFLQIKHCFFNKSFDQLSCTIFHRTAIHVKIASRILKAQARTD